MGYLLNIILSASTSFASLMGVDIPFDKMTQFELQKGFEVWVKEISCSSQVACRFVTHDLLYGKPQNYPFDDSKDVFEDYLPYFLDFCEEKVNEKKSIPLGMVFVGGINGDALRNYLEDRYSRKSMNDNFSDKAVQLQRSFSEQIEVLLSYPKNLQQVNTDADLKKMWAFFLIQSMAENRFKAKTVEAEGKWVEAENAKSLLPTLSTVGHGIEQDSTSHVPGDRLLKGYLSVVQLLKEKGFSENELADSKARLMNHIHRFYSTCPHESTLVEYYASHMAALMPCSSYKEFMSESFRVVPEITMGDISDVLKDSFKDDSRKVLILQPEDAVITETSVQEILDEFESDRIEFNYTEPEQVVVEAEKDVFLQLPLSDDEKNMIQDIIQTVGSTSKVRLAWLKSDLEKKKMKLVHIHPLRSIAAMVADPYTKQCLGEIMDDWVKRSNFISDYTKRLNREVEKDNIMMYVPGFCLAVKANPEQVYSYIASSQWENLFRYLLMLNH